MHIVAPHVSGIQDFCGNAQRNACGATCAHTGWKSLQLLSSTHASAGTERCHEAVTKMPGSYDIVINIQGDEPLIDPHVIDDVVKALQDSPDSVYRCACLCTGVHAC